MKFIPRMLCLFLAMHAAAETCTASYEVGFDFNYRSDDAIFPKMRECFLEEDRKVTSFIETRQPSWQDKEFVAQTIRRFRAEYPEDGVSDEVLGRVLRHVQMRHVPGTKLLTVAVSSKDRHLSECLAGTFARSLVRYVDEVNEREVTRDLAPLRAELKKKDRELADLRSAAEKSRKEAKDHGLAQPAEYVRLARLRSEKVFPEYQKLFLEDERQTRARELDKIVAFVLGPVQSSGHAESDVRTRCLKAERLVLKEMERQRREWNDRWEDRLEQIRLRAECPRRKYLLLPPDELYDSCGIKGICARNAAVNTNSPLYGFLGCPFGEKSEDAENYVRCAQPFEGFPWVRYDTCRNNRNVARCDARLTFRTTGLSEVPFRRMLRVRDEFRKRYGLTFVEERRGEDYFAEAYMSPGYRVGLFVVNALVPVGDTLQVEYVLGFEVVNEQVLPECVRRMQDTFLCNWHDVLHVTEIPQTRRNDDAAWTYRVAKGLSTEELLDESIRTGDHAILKLGKHEVGTPVGWSRGGTSSGYFAQYKGENTGYFCTEWEADLFLATVGSFVKLCDLETQKRISAKLYHPDMFRRREKRKTGNYIVGSIYCDLIPGDRVTWDTAEARKTGTVCEDGESGEYWDCIKKNMKNVETVERAKEEDWRSTKLAEDFTRRRYEVDRKCDQIYASMWRYRSRKADVDLSADTNLVAVVNFLDACLADRQPGVYEPPHLESIFDPSYPSRELARRKVRHWENMRLAELQAALYSARRKTLDGFFSKKTFGIDVPSSVARMFSLSRYECERYGTDRELFKPFESSRLSRYMVIPLHYPLAMPPYVFTADDIARARRILAPFEGRLVDFGDEKGDGSRKTEGGDVVLMMYEILHSAFSSPKGHEAVADMMPRCRTIVAANLHQDPMLWLVRRVTIEFKDNPAAWKFAEDVKAELERLEHISFAGGRAKAKELLDKWLNSDWAKKWWTGEPDL